MSGPMTLTIVGLPAPQGSKRHVGGGRMVEMSKNVAPWREAVAAAARLEMVATGMAEPLDGALSLSASFRLPMPTSRPKRVREAGRQWRTSTPDLDKLLRSTLDGLVMGGLIVDDARVVSIEATKCEVVGWSGVTLRLRAAGEELSS